MLRADLHVHTKFSMDCESSLEQIIKRSIALKINCLAIADHGTIAGALKLKEIAPFPIIIAEEILTPHGEIMGMFLTKEVPTNSTVENVISCIKEQNGLICIPHPYDKFRPSAFNDRMLEQIISDVDIIEVYNARSITPGCIKKANHLAQKYNKLASAGSDAHAPEELGSTYIEMPEFNTKAEFLQSLAHGKIIGHKSNILVHLTSTKNKIEKRILRKE